jgi:hypothetical protein
MIPQSESPLVSALASHWSTHINVVVAPWLPLMAIMVFRAKKALDANLAIHK